MKQWEFIAYPVKYDVVEDATIFWYTPDDLMKLMDHEIQIALRDRDGKHPSYTCTRGIEHLLAGEAKDVKIYQYCQDMLYLQSQLKQGGESKSRTAKILRSQSQGKTREDRMRALQLGFLDASNAKQINFKPCCDRHGIGGSAYRLITGDFRSNEQRSQRQVRSGLGNSSRSIANLLPPPEN